MLQSIDLTLISWLVPGHTPALDAAMTVMSTLGRGAGLWTVLAILALAAPRSRAAAFRALLAIGVTLLINDAALKPLVARGRPLPVDTAFARELPVIPPTYSFPSGHTSASVAGAMTLSRVWPSASAALWAAAALTAYSRIYLGHHYPLDVLGGALVGVLVTRWVLGGRHPATDARTLPRPLPPGVVLRP